MNIRFAATSKGTYHNAGSCRNLANYLEHEDLERMEAGEYIEGFFNLTEENLYKSQVIKDIDSNIGQLLKTDAKFFAVHISPSQTELQQIGTTQQEQADSMRRYIREVFIPTYAENFNKDLTADDIKFYAKIHFDRKSTRSKQTDHNNENTQNEDNENRPPINNMHCHIIISRKDQSNKKKLSPLTNHKNTKKGKVKGGFDRTKLFQKVEEGFDALFNYIRPSNESFNFYNTMRNGTITDQIKIQERMDAFTNSLQHEVMSSGSQSSSQSMSQLARESTSQLAIQKKQEEERKRNIGLKNKL